MLMPLFEEEPLPLVGEDVIRAKVYCYTCMKREVVAVGEMCRICRIPEVKPRGLKQASEMTLEQLIATQDDGLVPGELSRIKTEIPVDPNNLRTN